MAKFVTKRIREVDGRQEFRQLIIVPDNVDIVGVQAEIDRLDRLAIELKIEGIDLNGVLDIYEQSLPPMYLSSYHRIIGNMNRVANLQSVPPEKFKDVTKGKNETKEFEFKYQDLRVWTIKIPNGQLVIHGGFKSTQKNGFTEFRNLKGRFLNL